MRLPWSSNRPGLPNVPEFCLTGAIMNGGHLDKLLAAAVDGRASDLHLIAGRMRATIYRRNGHPELSIRFCGDHIPNREQPA